MWANFIRRLQEPSTHAGIAALAVLASTFGVPVTTAQAVSQAVVAVTGVAAVFLPETK